MMNRMKSRAAMLTVALALVAAAGITSPASARRAQPQLGVTHAKYCYYAGQQYSVGACRGGQACRFSQNGDYWDTVAGSSDDCGLQYSPGGGRFPQV